MLTRSAWFLVGTLCMGWFGCGDPSEGDNTETATDPARASEEDDPLDTGPFAPEDAAVAEPSIETDASALAGQDAQAEPSPSIEEASYRSLCEENCASQSDCVGLSDVQCAEECSALAQALAAHACLTEAFDELTCLGTLSCEELWVYGTKGRRDHPTCGAQAVAYFEACTVGAGEVPTDCQAMCARFAGCNALDESVAACEEMCVLRATGASWNVGAECSDAFLAVAGCVADASCADVTELQTLGTIPPSCVAVEAARDAACN